MVHIISSTTHPFVKQLLRLKTEKQFRNDQKLVLLEGRNLISDVAKVYQPLHLLAKNSDTILSTIRSEHKYIISDAILKKLASTQHPSGPLAVFAFPSHLDEAYSNEDKKKLPSIFESKKFVVALNRIQDPSNIGSIFRSSLALGWEALFLINGTCDPMNDKALRSAKGATFFLPYAFGSWSTLMALIKQHQWTAVMAHKQGPPPEAYHNSIGGNGMVLVLNNESGLSSLEPQEGQESTREQLSKTEENYIKSMKKVAVPMPGSQYIDSLNVAVAGAILMHSFKNAVSSKKK